MKRIILLTAFLFFNMLTYGQASFKKAVTGLKDIGYHIQNDSRNITVKPSENWYNFQARRKVFRGQGIVIDTIQPDKIISIKAYYVKGNKAILPKTYGRATIQEWTFTDAAESEHAINCITKNNSIVLEKIHKAPWTVWQSGNKLYFILTGGTYMIDELKKLESKLKKGIKNDR